VYLGERTRLWHEKGIRRRLKGEIIMILEQEMNRKSKRGESRVSLSGIRKSK